MSNMGESKESQLQTDGDVEKNAKVATSTQAEYPPLKVSIPIVICIYMVVFLCALVSSRALRRSSS
jgi:hypothetical protein